jgi:hypothetical protein
MTMFLLRAMTMILPRARSFFISANFSSKCDHQAPVTGGE